MGEQTAATHRPARIVYVGKPKRRREAACGTEPGVKRHKREDGS